MSTTKKRIDDIAKAAGVGRADDSGGAVADAIQQARRDGTLFNRPPITSPTLQELEADIAHLEAIKRPTASDRFALRIARAKFQVGAYAGSPAEQRREVERLVGPITATPQEERSHRVNVDADPAVVGDPLVDPAPDEAAPAERRNERTRIGLDEAQAFWRKS